LVGVFVVGEASGASMTLGTSAGSETTFGGFTNGAPELGVSLDNGVVSGVGVVPEVGVSVGIGAVGGSTGGSGVAIVHNLLAS